MIPSYERCQYNWELDIKNALPPPIVGYESKVYTPEELNRPLTFGTPELGPPYWLVTADPNDIIVLMNCAGEKTRYPAHCNVWQNTIDHYLCEYYTLSRKKYEGSVVMCMLAGELQTKLQNYKSASADRQKPLPQNIQLGKLSEPNTSFLLPAFASAEYRNQLYRWIDTPATATNQISSIEYDGLPFVPHDSSDYFPFTLIDYIEHEYHTGVSLSIEITAVLLEINPSHRDEVLDVFVQDAMSAIIRCPYLFTRNTVARQYIQQIIMECTPQNSYEDQFSSSPLWRKALEHAQYHPNRLSSEHNSDNADVSDREQIDAILNKITSLLSQVCHPINLPAYVEHPTHGLPVFCNGKHANVEKLLQIIVEQEQQPARCRREDYILFRKVHSHIRTAIQEGIRQMNKKVDP